MILTPTKILIILAVIAVFIGYKKLPEMGKGLGEAIRNFRKSVTEPEEIDITPKTEKAEEDNEARPDPKAENKERPRAQRTPNRAVAARKR